MRIEESCGLNFSMYLNTAPASLAVLILFVMIFAASTAPLNPYLGTHYTVDNGNADSQNISRKPYLEVRNSTYHGAGPREEARAMCSVRTQEVNATANATITRRLHGVVTSRELHSSIHRLEVILHGQMHLLWQSLDALRGALSASHTVQLPQMAVPLFPDRNTVSFRYPGDAG